MFQVIVNEIHALVLNQEEKDRLFQVVLYLKYADKLHEAISEAITERRTGL